MRNLTLAEAKQASRSDEQRAERTGFEVKRRDDLSIGVYIRGTDGLQRTEGYALVRTRYTYWSHFPMRS